MVTSETATVLALEVEARALLVRMDDGGDLRRLEGEELSGSRLAHAYAVTVHRSQGSTVQRAHALEDGGGRELAYVKMSRARERSTVYVVADDAEQAREDLVREWSTERRPSWVIDSATPVTDPAGIEASLAVARPMRDALRRGRLTAERAAIAAVIPPDPSAEIRALEHQQARVRHQREALAAGSGRYAEGAVGHAFWQLRQADIDVRRLERDLERPDASRRDRRRSRSELAQARQRHRIVTQEVAAITGPETARLDGEDRGIEGRLSRLRPQSIEHRCGWTATPKPPGGSTT